LYPVFSEKSLNEEMMRVFKDLELLGKLGFNITLAGSVRIRWSRMSNRSLRGINHYQIKTAAFIY